MEENKISLLGRVADPPVPSHQSHGKTFFTFPLSVPRLSGVEDKLNLLAHAHHAAGLISGDLIRVTGDIRSFNNHSGVGSRLVITVFVHTLVQAQGSPENDLSLHGILCRPPNYRRTPLGREICDLMLAVPRKYGRTDYLPCIAWGAAANRAACLSVGCPIALTGRLQSRTYMKNTPEGAVEKVAFEVSVTQLEAL